MTSVANKIIELQDKIRETENYIARYEGQRDSLIEELKQKFDGLAIENAEEHLNKLDEQLKEKQEEYAKAIADIKEKFPELCGDLL